MAFVGVRWRLAAYVRLSLGSIWQRLGALWSVAFGGVRRQGGHMVALHWAAFWAFGGIQRQLAAIDGIIRLHSAAVSGFYYHYMVISVSIIIF